MKKSHNLHPPAWIFNRVRHSQVSSQVVAQQYHGLQTQFVPPLFYRLHKLILCSLGIRGEQRSGALSEAQ